MMNSFRCAVRLLPAIVLALGCLISPAAGQQVISGATPDASDVASAMGASKASLQELDFSEYPDGELLVEVNLPHHGMATLSLYPHSVRSDLFKVLVDDGVSMTEHPAPPIRTRKGTVLEIPGSRVSGSYIDGHLTALILAGDQAWSITATEDLGFAGSGRWHGVVENRDEIDTPYSCATANSPVPPGSGTGGTTQSFGTTYYLTEIGIDADFEFFQQNNSNVNSTVADIENVMNSVESVYEDTSILISYEITVIVVRTSSADPYGTTSGAGALLNAFGNVWSSSPENQIQRDVAHFFTGVNIDGGTIGIASLSVICTGNAYGLSQSKFTNNFNRRVALTAHELGHNWSSQHCDSANPCRIMCSVLAGCNGISPLTFSSGPIAQIVNHRNSRSCLTGQAPELALPFEEEFPGGGINSTRWTYNEGCSISTVANGEPSSPYSLNLDRAGTGPYQYDEIRSNTILLGGTVPTLQFYSNHSGVEAGEELVVEYLNVSLSWTELDRIESNGANPTTFQVHTYQLPANARHNGFRMRFYTNTNETNDDWYIDDVTVTDGPPPQQEPPAISGITPPSGPTTGGTFITINGQFFSQDILILIGGSMVTDLTYLSPNQLVGYTPSTSAPGPASVIASQLSGSDLLDPGFLYTEEYIIHNSGAGSPGGVTDIGIIADHDTIISGYSLAVDFDPTELVIISVGDVGTVAEGADFFQATLNNDVGPSGGWWTLGVVLAFNGSSTILPSTQTMLANASYVIQPTVPAGTFLSVTPVDGVGIPPTDNLLSTPAGVAIPPLLDGGLISVGASAFVRGDGNSDSTVDVADAVYCLAYLFSGGPADCLDAIDANDDGATNIADAVKVLDFLFAGGSAPPAPYPAAGSDPTSDSLDCDL